MSWFLPWNWRSSDAPKTKDEDPVPIVPEDQVPIGPSPEPDPDHVGMENLANSMIFDKTSEEMGAMDPEEFGKKVKETWDRPDDQQKDKWRRALETITRKVVEDDDQLRMLELDYAKYDDEWLLKHKGKWFISWFVDDKITRNIYDSRDAAIAQRQYVDSSISICLCRQIPINQDVAQEVDELTFQVVNPEEESHKVEMFEITTQNKVHDGKIHIKVTINSRFVPLLNKEHLTAAISAAMAKINFSSVDCHVCCELCEDHMCVVD